MDVDAGHSKRSQLALTLITLRTRRLLSHEVLATRAKKFAGFGESISAKTIGNIESDRHKVTLGKLRAIAAALEVEVWQLFLPPVDEPSVVRDITLEVSRRSTDDQRDILKLVRKIPPLGGEPDTPTRVNQLLAGR
jgi:transcriptional regulator with XRE-family HTH domain